MNSTEVNLSEIKSNPNNPRIIKDDKFHKLVESIKTFPRMLEIRPIVVNKDMIVLGGNMRLRACKEAGIKKVPVIFADDLTEEQQREFIIKDNVGFGEWDWAMLANEWNTDELTEWGLDIPDFDTKELPEATEDDYEIPDEIQTDIVIGELFEIGEHRLLCGDSTNITDVEKLMNGENADTYIIDPPYEMEHLYHDSISILVKNKNYKLLIMWDFKRFAIASKIAIDCGWNPLYEFIWDNCQSWYTPNRPLQRHKALGVFGDDPEFDTESSIIIDNKDRGNKREVKNTRGSYEYTPIHNGKHISTVEQFPNTQEKDAHGHGKPIKWISAIILGIKSKFIYDAFCGSGAFMVASHQLKRKCYGMELDPKYCQVIIDRMRNLDPSLVIKRNGKEI
jgi:DNA modification methylase